VPEYLNQVATLAAKDLRVEFRSKEIILTMMFFAVVIVLMFSFAFLREMSDGRVVAVADVAPGFLFVSVLFAGTLGLSRAFDRERESDTMRGLLLSPVPRSAIFLGKAAGIVVFVGLTELVVLPSVWFFFEAPIGRQPLMLALVLVLATLGFAIVGTVFAAMLLRVPSRDVLLPVVLYPILMPLLIAGIKALAGVFAGNPQWFWIKFLIVYDASFAVAALWIFESLVIE